MNLNFVSFCHYAYLSHSEYLVAQTNLDALNMQSLMDSILLTKRLHISSLIPAITADDISRRLSTFGSVKCVDGIGLLDGLGAPRKFGYITNIETTA
jgi:hypothetical protein